MAETQISLDNIINLAKIKSNTQFITFKSINNIFELIYIYEENVNDYKKNSIICYDLTNFQKINEIKNENVSEIKHIFDSFNKRDLIISLSDHYVKIWNINTVEVIFAVNKYFQKVCFIKEKQQILFMGKLNDQSIIKSNLEIYDLTSGLIKIIKGLKFLTVYMETINKGFSIYILLIQEEFNNGFFRCPHIISYDYYNNKVYKKYLSNKKKWKFDGYNLIIYQKNSTTQLIVNDFNSTIMIFDFYSGQIMQEIKIDKPFEICVWNNHYLIGYYLLYEENFKTILELIDFEKGLVLKDIKTFNKHTMDPFHFKKIIHPFYGECLIGSYSNEIILLTNKK